MTKQRVIYFIAIIIPIAFIVNGILTFYVVRKNVEESIETALMSQVASVESIVALK